MSEIFQIISIGAALSNLVLTIFLFSREPRSTLNRTYFLWGISISIWNIGVFFMFRVHDAAWALFWARALHLGVIFLPVSLVHLALLVARIRVGRWIYLLYGLQTTFAVVNGTDLFIAGVHHTGYAYYSVAGPTYWLFLGVYAACAWSTLAVLYFRQKGVFPLHRVRLHALMIAAAILIVFGVNDIGPILGIYHYPGTEARIYPLGSLAAMFYSLIVSYSILQHQLLDIHVTLGKFAAHMVRLLFFSLIGFSMLLVTALVLPNHITVVAFFSCLAALMASGALASFLIPRLFGEGTDSLERRLLGDRFGYHDQIQGFIRSILWYSETSSLLEDFHKLLVGAVKLGSYQIFLQEEPSGRYALLHSHPPPQPGKPGHLGADAAIVGLIRSSKLGYLPVNPAYALSVDADLGEEARKELEPFAPEFCFPFKSDEEAFGILLLGGKSGQEPYTANDLYMFDLLVKNLAVVLNQIRLKNKVIQARELELLGRMSQGMAHDLNNLLTPISTFLQLCSAKGNLGQMPEGLLPIAGRNIRTIRDYIQQALFFSQTQTPQFKTVPLDALVAKVAETFQPALASKGIGIQLETPAGLAAEMDEVLLQRLLSNLLSNAIDASKPGADIQIKAEVVLGGRPPCDWVRLRVIDKGSGISRENLGRVLKPYFTTKVHGDANRGAGLGLAISRKIAQLHRGDLTIASEEGKGTTAQADFPREQPREGLPAGRIAE